MTDTQVTAAQPAPDAATTARWSNQAPRGGRQVFQRIVKDGANVPLFLGQTLINALRDLGYNHTTSALCEHVDNACQAGASEVRIFFHERGKKTSKEIDVLVYDNGVGMAPSVLRAVTSFGGSTWYDNRTGIGRYGMGMKAAAISLGPAVELYSWQEKDAFYRMILDTQAIANDRANLVVLPEPSMLDRLPPEIRQILATPMLYPKSPQHMLADDEEQLGPRLPSSGTIVYIPNCDRLTYRTSRALADHATMEMARVYRRQIDAGLRLYINNRLVEPFDPTYRMESARHLRIEELKDKEKRSRLVSSWQIDVQESEQDAVKVSPVQVRLFFLPIQEWDQLPRKVLKNDLHIFESTGISFVRNNREVHLGSFSQVTGRLGSRDSWWRIEVDFPAELDEAFGVAVNKQGVRPKSYVLEQLRATVAEELTNVRKRVEEHWSQRATEQMQAKSVLSEAERRANAADPLQATLLPSPTLRTSEEQAEYERDLRSLAAEVRRDGEVDDQAIERVRASTYLTKFTHDDDKPFYRVDTKLGKVLLTINTAHPFFERLYRPLVEVARRSVNSADSGAEEGVLEAELSSACAEAVTSLQILLLSLGRTQSVMSHASSDHAKLFDNLRKQWSMNLATQLTTA